MLKKTNTKHYWTILLWLSSLSDTPVFSQQTSITHGKQNIEDVLIPTENIQAPLIKKLGKPIITKAGRLSIIKNSPFQHHSILNLLLFWNNNLTIWDNSFNFIDS